VPSPRVPDYLVNHDSGQQPECRHADTLRRPHPPKVKVARVAPEDSITIWYVRHGENPANVTGELSCRTVDYPLTERGVAQARELAERLSRAPATPDASPVCAPPGYASPGYASPVYASPLRRAAQTAQIIADRLGLPVATLESLRELEVGDLEGRRDEQAWTTFLDVAYAWHAGDHDRAFPGGEDFHNVIARLRAALKTALDDHPPGSQVLMIAHDGLIRAALPALCPGTPLPATGLPKCGIARLAVRPAAGGIACALLHWPAPAED
jgi:probable phosphoglycerate mutase